MLHRRGLFAFLCPALAGMSIAIGIAMNHHFPDRQLFGRLALIAFFIIWSSVFCAAQGPQRKAEAEIRYLLNKSRSKDNQVATEVSEKLRKLNAGDLPVITRIMRRGKVCERVGAAGFIVGFEPNDRELLNTLTELATGGTVSSSEEELWCRREAAFQLAFSADGIRLLTQLLKEGKNLFVRQSALFAFDELTETANYPQGSLEAMREAIPFIAESGKVDDEVMQCMSDEVLRQIVAYGGEDLSKVAERYVIEGQK
jgi:hypothetical protein